MANAVAAIAVSNDSLRQQSAIPTQNESTSHAPAIAYGMFSLSFIIPSLPPSLTVKVQSVF